MSISMINCIQLDHIDGLGRDIVRFAVTARIGHGDYTLDVYVNRDNDDSIEFDLPEIAGFDADDEDELFSAVLNEVDRCLV